MTNELIAVFWKAVDNNKRGYDVCWDSVMWDIFFEYPELENDKPFVRDLYKLIDSVEDTMYAENNNA